MLHFGLHHHFHLSEHDRAVLSAALGLLFSFFLAGLMFYVFVHLHDFGA